MPTQLCCPDEGDASLAYRDFPAQPQLPRSQTMFGNALVSETLFPRDTQREA